MLSPDRSTEIRRRSSREFADDDDVEMQPSTSSSLLTDERDTKDEIPLCGCLSVRYYQPYFDVDTADVTSRLFKAVAFCRADELFINVIKDKPDAYGPFWIATTLVFSIAVTSHISSWISSWMKGDTWEYDFESVVSVATIIYGFTGAVPALLWFIFRQLEQPVKFITLLCLYGYSIFVFIPASIICLVPANLAVWAVLLVAGALSSVFLIRNLGPTFVAHMPQHASIAIGLIGLTQVIFAITIKVCFYSD